MKAEKEEMAALKEDMVSKCKSFKFAITNYPQKKLPPSAYHLKTWNYKNYLRYEVHSFFGFLVYLDQALIIAKQNHLGGRCFDVSWGQEVTLSKILLLE